MAYLVKDIYGEYLYKNKPKREKGFDFWMEDEPCIKLGEGEIEYFTGKIITFNDEPIEI